MAAIRQPKPDQRYRSGLKRCTLCAKYFKDMMRCPCCGMKLRTKPRSGKYRKYLSKDKIIS